VSDLPADLEFLLRAANYGTEPREHSPAARKAVELAAQNMAETLELKLTVTQARLKNLDPETLARAAAANREPL